MSPVPPDDDARSAYAPRPSEAEEMRRLREPVVRKPGSSRLPLVRILIAVAAGLAVGICAWSVFGRNGNEVASEQTSRTIVTLARPAPGQSLQDVCAAYGVPERLCNLSERCNARSPRRDGRVPLILRSRGEDCGAPPP